MDSPSRPDVVDAILARTIAHIGTALLDGADALNVAMARDREAATVKGSPVEPVDAERALVAAMRERRQVVEHVRRAAGTVRQAQGPFIREVLSALAHQIECGDHWPESEVNHG